MKIDKAIILAGGLGTRLYPITKYLSKHLITIYDKPMIYYPLSTLLKAGIKKYLIITNPYNIETYKKLLGNGSRLGVEILYEEQNKPNGIPESFLIARKFIGSSPVCLNLGDHIFFGKDINSLVSKNINNFTKNTIFSIKTENPNDYGVLKYDLKNHPVNIIEKPNKFISKNIVCGLYIYENQIVDLSRNLKLSKRNEYEISEINNNLLEENNLNVEYIDEGNYWIDAGTFNNIFYISESIKELANKNFFVGYIEHLAYKNNFITESEYNNCIDELCNSEYGRNLIKLKEINESY